MSASSWPTIGVKPASLPEHATQLKHEATQLHAFATGKTEEGKPRKTVQWSYIEPFVSSVKELAERVLDQPGTAQIAADLLALVRKIDTVEQNTTITKNILEAPVNRTSTPSILRHHRLQKHASLGPGRRTGAVTSLSGLLPLHLRGAEHPGNCHRPLHPR